MLQKITSKKSMTYIFLCFVCLLVYSIFQYGITKIYGMYIFPDEFGYWGSVASLLGYDWSEIIALGNYYSFGYSAILLPILKFVEDAATAYRVAIFMNAVLMCGNLFFIFHILKRIFLDIDEKILVLISAVAIFYPSGIYYMQTTLAESLLTFLLLAISTVMLHFMERHRGRTAVTLAILLCYIYFVHMRTMGLVIAGIFIVLFLTLMDTRYQKPCVVFCVTLVFFAVCGVAVKEIIVDDVYHKMSNESLVINNFQGQIHKIKALFSIDGIFVFLVSCIGKLFYLGAATFGLFYWAVSYLVKNLIEVMKKIKKKQKIDIHAMWFLFIATAVFLHFVVGAVFLMEHGPDGRIDALLYGRYNETLVPLMMCIGIVAIYHSKKPVQRTLFMIAMQGIFAFVVHGYIRTGGFTKLFTCHIAGLRYAVKETDFYVPEFIGIIFIVSSVLTLIFLGVILIVRKRAELFWLLGIIMAVEIFLGLSASERDIYTHNEENFREYKLAEEIENLNKDKKEIKYLYTGGTVYVDLLQFYLRDTKFIVLEDREQLELLQWDDLILMDADHPYGEELAEKYDSHFESNHFLFYYNDQASK